MYKSTLLRVLNEMCRDGQLLVDLFVNYDCDLDSLNLFERMVNGLVRTAQQPVAVGAGRQAGSSSSSSTSTSSSSVIIGCISSVSTLGSGAQALG
ncbi:MAG: hypothetical protein ACT6T3_22220, partial [Agrobacterium sp.]|uniref:hypothetical protein n=1 Tax=Agrobacterium sp. TaxID=361 RepID=UPI00403479D3